MLHSKETPCSQHKIHDQKSQTPQFFPVCTYRYGTKEHCCKVTQTFTLLIQIFNILQSREYYFYQIKIPRIIFTSYSNIGQKSYPEGDIKNFSWLSIILFSSKLSFYLAQITKGCLDKKSAYEFCTQPDKYLQICRQFNSVQICCWGPKPSLSYRREKTYRCLKQNVI